MSTTSLRELLPGQRGVVSHIQPQEPRDRIAQRLMDFGFVAGEPVRVLAKGPLGAEPLLVAVGSTRFALRHSEAARIWVQVTP